MIMIPLSLLAILTGRYAGKVIISQTESLKYKLLKSGIAFSVYMLLIVLLI